MESQLVKKWRAAGLKPSNFEYFTNRPNVIVGKLPDEDAYIEYTCPHCGFYEIKMVPMKKNVTKSGKQSKKYERPEFACSKCNKIIKVLPLKGK